MTYDYNESVSSLRDRTAEEIRAFRQEEESRYRETQMRNAWKTNNNGSLPMPSETRKMYEEVGKAFAENKERKSSKVNHDSSGGGLEFLGVLFFLGIGYLIVRGILSIL